MIHIKSQHEIDLMLAGGKILSEILRKLSEAVKVGMTTNDLDLLARQLVLDYGVESSFLGYNGFPAALCISINDEVVHGIPSSRVIEDGDLVSVDMGVLYKGFHTDSAVTVIAGKGDAKKHKLINITREALRIGVQKALPGNTTGDIGAAIQEYVEAQGFNVPRELVGHGVGKKLHEAPEVPNYGNPGEGTKLESGMVIAIEPMVVVGDWRVKEKGHVFCTKDGSLAAHFEHTVAVTEGEPIILTE